MRNLVRVGWDLNPPLLMMPSMINVHETIETYTPRALTKQIALAQNKVYYIRFSAILGSR